MTTQSESRPRPPALRRATAAADLWAVKVLGGLGLQMRVRTFRRLLLAGWAVSVPVSLLIGTVAVSLLAALVTDADAGAPANTAFASGLCAALVVLIAYGAALDLLRQHFTTARYAVSRSPLRGLWRAADISLPLAVAAERGPAVLWRASVSASVLAGGGVFVRRTDPTAGGDVLALAWMLPTAYVCLALALALVHATRDVRTVRPWLGAVVAVPLALVTGAALAGIDVPAGSPGQAAAGIAARVTAWGEVLPALRIGALVLLVPAVAVLTVTVAATPSQVVDGRVTGNREDLSDAGVTTIVLAGAGGMRRLQVGVRVGVSLAVATAAVLGWRLAGGPALPSEVRPVAGNALALVAAGAGMAIAATVLLVVGQTRRLWHYRTLWELGVPLTELVRGWIRPTLVLAAPAAVALGGLGWVLGAAVLTPVLVLLSAVASEHLVDSMFARTDTREGGRTANSVLAVVAFLFLVPPLLLAVAQEWWSPVALAAWLVLIGSGGVWWFSRRVQTLPLTART